MNKWDKRFMEMAELVSTWSSCYRTGRQVGAVIVKNKRILTTGYNGAPSGVKSCVEKGVCMRDEMGVASGTRAELCYAVHAEQNAICQAAKLGISVEGATIYVTHQPCVICAKMIVNSINSANRRRILRFRFMLPPLLASIYASRSVKNALITWSCADLRCLPSGASCRCRRTRSRAARHSPSGAP